MYCWDTRTLPQNGGHQRSASISGGNDMINGGYSSLLMTSPWNGSRLSQQYHTSFMDLNRLGGDQYNDSRQNTNWQAPFVATQRVPSYSVSTEPKFSDNPFKSAISKMKESSIYRLGTVDKTAKVTPPGQSLHQQNSDHSYYRNCMTLPPKKSMVDSQPPRQNHKIFKCNQTAEQGSDGGLSNNIPFIDCVSETESDKNYSNNQYRSASNLYSDHNQWQENSITNRNIYSVNKTLSNNGAKIHSGSHIVIPINKSTNSKQEKETMSVVSEPSILPKTVSKPKSAMPKFDQYKVNEENCEFDSISLTDDSKSNTETWTNDQNVNRIMSKSLNLTPEKPPIKKSQKSRYPRFLEEYQPTIQAEQVPLSSNGMSGLYKKTSLVSSKGKSINNMPTDFKKLHSAFLDQKNEIKRLKEELEEKKSYILELESEIRSYEPWR